MIRRLRWLRTLVERARSARRCEQLAIELKRHVAEARTLSETRADVLGIVAHDLRNPLNVIASGVGLLAELNGLAPAQRQQMLELVQRAVRRMNRMIGDLLDAARLQAGRLTLALEDVDVRDVLREAEESCRHEAAARRIRLDVRAPRHRSLIRADEGRLLQALGNLLGNAIKFTGEGGCVAVSARPGKREVVFRVLDTGPGIPPEHQAHLFESFWQAANGDRRGVGLGLAITKGIVDAHGGRIWVESTVGRGSVFSFALPVAADPAPAAAGPAMTTARSIPGRDK